MACALKFETVFDCYTEAEEQKKYSNFLMEQLEDALMIQPDTMGEQFIESYPTLKLFAIQYVYDNFGFCNCTLTENFQAFRDKKACEDQLSKK